jgi:AcrR family transcriptional regulator
VPKTARASRPAARDQVRETKRARILWAMAQAANDHTAGTVSVARVVSIAGISRKTFYEMFSDRDECLLAAVERSVALATEAARADEGRAEARRQPSPVTAEGIVGSILAIAHSRLLGPGPAALSALINPLMSFVALPYLGAKAAEMELSRPLPAPVAPRAQVTVPDLLEGVNMRLTYRTMSVLSAIAVQPGLSNRDVGIRSGITDQGQISKLLSRLAQLGLARNTGKGHASGAPNAWELTPRGYQLERTVKRASLGADRS